MIYMMLMIVTIVLFEFRLQHHHVCTYAIIHDVATMCTAIIMMAFLPRIAIAYTPASMMMIIVHSSTKVMVLVLMHIWLPKLMQASSTWLYGASYAPTKDCKIIHWHI